MLGPFYMTVFSLHSHRLRFVPFDLYFVLSRLCLHDVAALLHSYPGFSRRTKSPDFAYPASNTKNCVQHVSCKPCGH